MVPETCFPVAAENDQNAVLGERCPQLLHCLEGHVVDAGQARNVVVCSRRQDQMPDVRLLIADLPGKIERSVLLACGGDDVAVRVNGIHLDSSKR